MKANKIQINKCDDFFKCNDEMMLINYFDGKEDNGNNHKEDDIDDVFLRNVNEEEQVALWREGRRREPMPVEIDF